MTQKRAGRKQAKSATTVTVDRSTRLSAEEEKIIRMRKGLGAPDELELEFQGRDNPELWKKLRAIENRAFEQSGRIARMRQEAEAEAASEKPAPKKKADVKTKIITGLKQKTTAKKKPARRT